MQNNVIVFDFFGVICSEISPFWFAKYFPQQKAKQLKDSYMPPADTGNVSEDQLFQQLGGLIQKTADEVKTEFESYVAIDNEIVDLIKKLKLEYKLGLCSNSPSNFIRSILKKFYLTELFDEIVISSECGITKPEPEIYALILEKLSTKATDAIFIDDNPAYVETAQMLGFKTILFSDLNNLKVAFTDFDIEI